MRKALIVVFLLGLAGLVAFRLFQEFQKDASASAARPQARGQRVEVAPVQLTKITEELSLIGSLKPEEEVDVAPRVSGRVVEVRVDRGDAVQEGDLIARLDDEELQQQVSRAEASLQVARAAESQRRIELEDLINQLERFQSLYDAQLISAQDLEQMKTRVSVARAQVNLVQAQVASAQAELEELQIRLRQTRIYAPLTGVVGRRHVDPGAMVSPNTPIVHILKIDTMVSVIYVPERELPQIQRGQRATVLVDALAGSSFSGQVVRISPLIDPNTRTGEVEIEIPNTGRLFKAEMFIRVQLNLTSERRALVVPRDALVYRDGQQGVYILESDVARFRAVELGKVRGTEVEVIRGLQEGETVVTRGSNLLRDGDRVQLPRAALQAVGE